MQKHCEKMRFFRLFFSLLLLVLSHNDISHSHINQSTKRVTHLFTVSFVSKIKNIKYTCIQNPYYKYVVYIQRNQIAQQNTILEITCIVFVPLEFINVISPIIIIIIIALSSIFLCSL